MDGTDTSLIINGGTFISSAKNIEITSEQLEGRVIIHFGASDYNGSSYVPTSLKEVVLTKLK